MTAQPVAFSLGSNVGDSLATLSHAVRMLRATPNVELRAVSSVYRTAPVGGVDQPDFLNVVVVGVSELPPVALLGRCHVIEAYHGRTRELRWGPRTLDVDLLAVGDERATDDDLTLPHPRAHERAFVLVPWAEADPDAVLPGHGRVADLAAAVGDAGVERTDLAL